MLKTDSPHSERFNELLGELNQEVDALKDQIEALEKEKSNLKKELKETREKEADVFSSVKETERMALKHQIKGLVSKIDEHLENKA